MHELRLAARRVRRSPGRALAVASTLAIGVATTTTAFSALDVVFLRDLPVDEQKELVVVSTLNPERGSLPIPFRAAGYEAVVRGVESLVEAAGVSAWGALPAPIGEGADSYVLNRAGIAGDFFGVLGAHPALGRLPGGEDDRPGARPVAALSYSAWRGRFGSDPGVVGSTLLVDGTPVAIVGVAPEGLDYPRGTDLWSPLRIDYARDQGFTELHVVGRHASGADVATIAADVASAVASSAEGSETRPSSTIPVVRGFEEEVRGSVQPMVRAAFAAASMLLVAAVANVTFLLLVGGRGAVHDIAVRRALGAERSSVLGRMLADAAMPGAVGLVVGIGLAAASLSFLLPLLPPELARLEGVAVDRRAIVFAVFAGAASLAVSGGIAALVVSGFDDPGAALSPGGRAEPSRSSRLRRGLVALQVGLTVVTATGAGLLIRTLRELERVDPGMAAEEISAATLRVPYDWFDVPERYFAALEAVVGELEASPGVVAARPTLGPPLQQRLEVALVAEGQDEGAAAENPYVAIDAILPGHFQALGIRLVAGRTLTELDNRSDADAVVVVDRTLAEALWPGESPLGMRISGFGPDDTWFTVVGLVEATRYREYLTPHPRAYYPLRRLGSAPPAAFLVRTDPRSSVPVEALMRGAFERADPAVRLMGVEPLAQALRRPTLGRRFAAGVLAFFAVATLLLGMLGVYGVFSVSVQERTREMGLRRALGAPRAGIVRLVLVRILRVAAAGIGVGLAVAVLAGRLVESMLYGVSPVDPVTLTAVVVGSLLLALLAGLFPALRAAAADPAVSLRAD